VSAYTIAQFVITMEVLIPATVIDVKKHKIPNFITFPFILVSFILACCFSLNGLWESFIGIAILFCVVFIEAMGIGDVKLLMGLTLLSGWRVSLMTLTFGIVLFLLYEFIRHPKKIWKKSKIALQAIRLKSALLLNDKTYKKPFALYLTIGYIIAYTLMDFLHVLEVF